MFSRSGEVLLRTRPAIALFGGSSRRPVYRRLADLGGPGSPTDEKLRRLTTAVD